jgi:putative endonuclease
VPYFVYILVSLKDGTLYTGQTNNLKKRLEQHNKGLVKSTLPKAPFRIAYFEKYETRSDAMFREWEFKKKWNTDRKKKLIRNFAHSKIEQILEP